MYCAVFLVRQEVQKCLVKLLNVYDLELERTHEMKDDIYSKHMCGFILFGFIYLKCWSESRFYNRSKNNLLPDPIRHTKNISQSVSSN